jgi:hypothetical protein
LVQYPSLLLSTIVREIQNSLPLLYIASDFVQGLCDISFYTADSGDHFSGVIGRVIMYQRSGDYLR